MSVIETVPFWIGAVMILAGLAALLMRTKGSVHTEGTVYDTAKSVKRRSRVSMDMEAPVVRYKVDGVEYSGVSRKFFVDGVMDFNKGKTIKIRVSRFDHRKFVPEESGGIAEKLLIFGGIFMILANIVILIRY